MPHRIDPTGSVPTPPALAGWICRRALGLFLKYGSARRTGAAPTVLDPAVGDGVFLVEMDRAWNETAGASTPPTGKQKSRPNRPALFGIDIQPNMVAAARRRATGAELKVGNFLLEAPPGPGRYDIIVGNPPYLGQRDVTRLDYAQDLFGRYGFKDDLYVYFIRRSLELLSEGGVLAMVTSDSWLTLMGKEPLRRDLLRHRLDHVMRLPFCTFQRHIYACCFGLVRDGPRGSVWYADAAKITGAGRILVPRPASERPDSLTFRAGPSSARSMPHAAASPRPLSGPRTARLGRVQIPCPTPVAPHFEPGKGRSVPQSAYLKAPGSMIFNPTPEFRRLNSKVGPTLARWWAGRFSERERSGPWRAGDIVPFGEVASVSDVGIHSRNCRYRLFFAEKAAPHLQRLLQGRQIERWGVRWNAPNARYRWVDVSYRPRAGVKGVGRGGQPSRLDEYWQFQGDPAVHRLPERILIRQTGDEIVAAYLRRTSEVYYTDNTLFTCLLTDRALNCGLTYRYVLAYLNSAAANRVYHFLSQERHRRQAQVKIGLLRILPFRVPLRREVARVDLLVDEIINARSQDAGDELDRRVAECDTYFEK